jgi:predicted nucleic acid-binding protein
MGVTGMVSRKIRSLGIVDVSIIVLSHCENPAKEEAVDFIEKIFLGETDAKIPLSDFIGAYHIMTRYLRINRNDVATALLETLNLQSPSFVSDMSLEDVIHALENAITYNIEGWDGYLVFLAEKLGGSIIYTIDQKLVRVKHLSIVIPISEVTVKAYHDWVTSQLQQ